MTATASSRAMATKPQVAAIRTLQKRVGMDDDTYRAFLHTQAGVRSTKLLTASDAGRVIDALKDLAGQGKPLAKGSVTGLDTTVGRKLRALWISGWNLGLVRDRTDRAMLKFLERQTGVSHVKFLAPEHAYRAIEALKSMLSRGGVVWPSPSPHPSPRKRGEGVEPQNGEAGEGQRAAQKRAVIDAQWQRLADLAAVTPLEGETLQQSLDRYAFKVTWKNGWCFFESRDYDAVITALGKRLRAALTLSERE